MKTIFKPLVAASLLAICSTAAHAQIGVRAGYLSSATKFNPTDAHYVIKDKAQSGIFVGVDYTLPLTVQSLSLRSGLTYSHTSGKGIVSSMLGMVADYGMGELGDSEEMLKFKEINHSLSLPIDVKYTFELPRGLKVYAIAGPRIAIGLSSIIKANYGYGERESYNLYSGKSVYKYDGETETDDSGEGVYSRFDLQFGVGTGVQYKRYSLELGYDWGILNRLKGDYGGDNVRVTRNRFYLGVGYSF
jgi:hypothetical protein